MEIVQLIRDENMVTCFSERGTDIVLDSHGTHVPGIALVNMRTILRQCLVIRIVKSVPESCMSESNLTMIRRIIC